MSAINSNKPQRLAVSRIEAARAIGCSRDHVDDLVDAGELEKVSIGPKRVVITWASLAKLIEQGVSEEGVSKMRGKRKLRKKAGTRTIVKGAARKLIEPDAR